MYSLILEVFIVTILPVILLETKIVNSKYRIYTFGLCSIIALTSVVRRRISLQMLGLTFDNIIPATLFFSIMTAVGLALIYYSSSHQFFKFIMKPNVKSVLTPKQYLLISAPVQQFIYFGFLYALLKPQVDSQLYIAIIIGFLFSLMHVPWRNKLLTIITFAVGVIWGYVYTIEPNLFVSVITHIVLGGALLKTLNK